MIEIYAKRNKEKKLAKVFNNTDNFINKVKAMVYIVEFKKYLKENNYTNIKLLVNDKHLQNIANNI